MKQTESLDFFENSSNTQPKFNPFTLSFKDPVFEKAYQSYTYDESLRQMRLAHLLTLVFYFGFTVMDYILVPDLNPRLLLMRIVVNCLLLLGFALTFHPAFVRFYQQEIHVMVFLLEASLLLVSFYIGSDLNHLYLDGLVAIILFSYILIRVRFIWISATNLMVLLLFFILYSNHPIDWHEHIFSDAMRLSLTNIVGVGICYTYEFASRRRYLLLDLLRQEQEKSDLANHMLEENVRLRTEELSQTNEQLREEIEEHQKTHRRLELEHASLEQRVSERTAELGLANDELARALRMRNEFLANMSHELRTPLNAILGMSEILLERTRGCLDETSTRHLNTIQHSGQKLLTLINNVLDLAKLESARLDLECEDVSIEMVCQASLQSIKRAAKEKNITVKFDISLTCEQIRADPLRLKQMLFNLLDNAIKFTPENGLIGLEVSCIRDNEAVQFTVWDTGIGIKPEQMSRLFMPFVQVDSSLERNYEGTGMGLVLVARLAELHGGSVAVESSGDAGKGSHFSLWLPSLSYQYCYTQQTFSSPEEARSSDIHFRHAVIIVNASNEADHIRSILENMGIETEICANTSISSCLDTFTKTDIILLDMLEPGQEGWQLLHQLKTAPSTRHIPVILISSVNEQVRGLGMGADAFLLKPVYTLKLQRTLRRIARSARLQLLSGTDRAEMFTILLVDDNEITNDLLSDALMMENLNYRLVVARSGMEAIERTRENFPGLIIIDAQIHDVDGVDAIFRLHTQAELTHIPIIALTSIDSPAEREHCMQAGARYFLRKPADIHYLVSIIEELREKPADA